MEAKDPITLKIPDVPIPVRAVMRRLGYPDRAVELEGEVASVFESMCRAAPDLMKPAGVYRICPIKSRTRDRILLEPVGFTIRSHQVSKMLKGSERIVLFMVTIGAALEAEVKRLFERDHMAEAVILDAIGSETADAVADRLHRDLLASRVSQAGLRVTPRFSPGYGDWPVTVQKEFLDYCGGDRIGISVNESFLMTPRKSVSAVFGLQETKKG